MTQVLACSVGLCHCVIRPVLPGALLSYFCKHLYCDEYNNNGSQSTTVYTAELFPVERRFEVHTPWNTVILRR
jgi:hypothetical protein